MKEKTNEQVPTKKLAKFEPPDGKCIVFAGQSLEAIGGLEEYNNGYYDHFTTPGGFTMYTTFMPGFNEFGFIYKGLDGISSTDNWGDGNSNMSLQLADEDFKHSALAIGLKLVDHEDKVADGTHDSLVIAFANWLKGLGKRPVYLRIGYEFGGEWNNYDRVNYLKAYKRIKDICDSMQVNNVAYVWQSHGWGMSQEELEAWYPGDDYVDWCSYSFFNRFEEVQMIDFARKKGKPVFIAEASPTISTATAKQDGTTKDTDLSNPEQAQEAWEKWFVPFFKTIRANLDIIKAINYINTDWKYYPMWKDNPTFKGIDARLQLSPEISKKWKEEIADPIFLNASPELFDILWQEKAY